MIQLLQSLGVCMYTSLKYTYLHGNHIVSMHGLSDTFLVPKAILEVSQVYGLFPRLLWKLDHELQFYPRFNKMFFDG